MLIHLDETGVLFGMPTCATLSTTRPCFSLTHSSENQWSDDTDVHAAFRAWVHQVRDPAEQASEGVRRLDCRGASAEYEIASLSNGKYALKYSLAYRCGDYWSRSTPWSEFESRESCIEAFLAAARGHFRITSCEDNRGVDDRLTSSQKVARSKMQELLSSSELFGFIEPAPTPRVACHVLPQGTPRSSAQCTDE